MFTLNLFTESIRFATALDAGVSEEKGYAGKFREGDRLEKHREAKRVGNHWG